jgi:pimeloyl-ACP methyl ester carboxylesterase
MATYALIHGAADSAWYWHLVEGELRGRGQDVVAVDLPCEDGSAGWSEYADTVVEAVADRTDLVVVAQSLGGVHRIDRLRPGGGAPAGAGSQNGAAAG